MRFKPAIMFVLTAIASQPVSAFAEVPPEFANRGCSFYDDPNGNGVGFRYTVNEKDGDRYRIVYPTLARKRDNVISFVRCNTHCSVALYDRTQRAGGEIAVIDGQAGAVSLAGQNADNKTSSLAVFCAR